jgi:hypothetical protein
LGWWLVVYHKNNPTHHGDPQRAETLVSCARIFRT